MFGTVNLEVHVQIEVDYELFTKNSTDMLGVAAECGIDVITKGFSRIDWRRLLGFSGNAIKCTCHGCCACKYTVSPINDIVYEINFSFCVL